MGTSIIIEIIFAMSDGKTETVRVTRDDMESLLFNSYAYSVDKHDADFSNMTLEKLITHFVAAYKSLVLKKTS